MSIGALLYKMNDISESKFAHDFYSFHEKRGTPIVKAPFVNKVAFDFYKVFNSVQRYGGYEEVNNKKLWKSVAIDINQPITQTTFSSFAKNYEKYILPFERVRVLHLPDHPNDSNENLTLSEPKAQEILISFLRTKNSTAANDMIEYEERIEEDLRPVQVPSIHTHNTNLTLLDNLFQTSTEDKLVLFIYLLITCIFCC